MEETTAQSVGEFNPKIKVTLRETNLFGEYLYRVFVNEYMMLDSFFSKTPLTWTQMSDVEGYYLDGLTGRTWPKRLEKYA